MENEIIGYVLVKEEYAKATEIIMNANYPQNSYEVTVGSCIKSLINAGVLDLWFEPIYKEEKFNYKVGDYIIFYELTDLFKDHIGDVVKITNIIDNKTHTKWIEHTPTSFSGGGFGYDSFKNNFRLATIEEYATANKNEFNVGDWVVTTIEARPHLNKHKTGNHIILKGNHNIVLSQPQLLSTGNHIILKGNHNTSLSLAIFATTGNHIILKGNHNMNES